MMCFEVSAQASSSNLSLECTRKDTFDVHPLESPKDLRSFADFIEQAEPFDLRPSLTALEKAFEYAKEAGLRKEKAFIAYQLLRHYSTFDVDYKKRLSISNLVQNELEYLPSLKRSSALNLIANTYASNGDQHSALAYYHKAIETADSTRPLDKVYPLGNLSTSYLANNDTTGALKVIHQLVELTSNLESEEEVAYNHVYDYSLLAEIHLAKGGIDSSMYYIDLASKFATYFKPEALRYPEMQATLLPVAIPINIEIKKHNIAFQQIKKLETLRPELAALFKAQYFFSIGDLNKALRFTNKKIENELIFDRRRIELRNEIALALKNYKIAEESSKQLLAISQNNLTNSKKALTTISQLQMEAFKKERRADAVRFEQELDTLQTRQRIWMAGALSIFSIGIAVWFNQRYRRSHKRSVSLSKMVTQHENDLIKANKQLASKVKSMERFNHLLSHDLREPLRSISGFTSIISRKVKSDDRISGDFDMLSKSVEQLKYLMTGVEELRRAEEHSIEPVRIDLKNLLADLSSSVRSKYPEIEIKLSVQGDLSPVVMDEKFLTSSLLELIDNAAKFCKDQKAYITIKVIQQNNELQFNIQDEGIGIDTEFNELIFGVFKRLNRREHYVGSGVGLALVKLATERCSGTVKLLESQIGKGSTFQISFPLGIRKARGLHFLKEKDQRAVSV